MKAPFPLPNLVLKDIRAAQPRDVLRQISEALALAEGIDAAALTKALIDAENAGGSAIGDGVAVVSARVSSSIAPRRLCAFVHMAKAASFHGIESRPCDLVFVLVSPDDQTQAHLRDLSVIIRTLHDRDFAERLRQAPNIDRVNSLFRARDIALSKAA